MQPIFRSGGFIHEDDQHSAAIIEDGDKDEACTNFVFFIKSVSAVGRHDLIGIDGLVVCGLTLCSSFILKTS